MKILMTNHGYPVQFNAGSEIYTQNLTHELLNQGHHVEVFSRNENPFLLDFEMVTEERTSDTNTYPLHLVNVARQKDRYQSNGVDRQFGDLLDEIKPDIVHVNHLNHLSLGIIQETSKRSIPVIFTLHDFWLACPRGQFIQINYGERETYNLCNGQEDRKCAVHCYSRYYTGLEGRNEKDIEYWSHWVRERQRSILTFIKHISRFIAPSPSLMKRMTDELGIPDNKIILLDYGFNRKYLRKRSRKRSDTIVFGYIGTHIVAKGIHHLLEAFSQLQGNVQLRIYGRHRSETTNYLMSSFPSHNIVWCKEYRNEKIVDTVFNQVDIIVVPSIWTENSPLVIHEAQQVRIPVITANAGGMADYVHHELNGLLYNHRDPQSLKIQMQRMVDEPVLIDRLGNRGYLFSQNGNVLSIKEHTQKIIEIYKEALK